LENKFPDADDLTTGITGDTG